MYWLLETLTRFSRLISSDILPLNPEFQPHHPHINQHIDHILWCIGQVAYVPQLVFPFVLLFGSDELAAFETAMTVLMWWGHSFHATFPHPPVHITGKYCNLVAYSCLSVCVYVCVCAYIYQYACLSLFLTNNIMCDILCLVKWNTDLIHCYPIPSDQSNHNCAPRRQHRQPVDAPRPPIASAPTSMSGATRSAGLDLDIHHVHWDPRWVGLYRLTAGNINWWG